VRKAGEEGHCGRCKSKCVGVGLFLLGDERVRVWCWIEMYGAWTRDVSLRT
jgi:hypothetical protein